VRAGGDAGLLACSHDGSLLAYIPDQGTDDIIELYMVNPDGEEQQNSVWLIPQAYLKEDCFE
jgi:hypothetical protein